MEPKRDNPLQRPAPSIAVLISDVSPVNANQRSGCIPMAWARNGFRNHPQYELGEMPQDAAVLEDCPGLADLPLSHGSELLCDAPCPIFQT